MPFNIVMPLLQSYYRPKQQISKFCHCTNCTFVIVLIYMQTLKESRYIPITSPDVNVHVKLAHLQLDVANGE